MIMSIRLTNQDIKKSIVISIYTSKIIVTMNKKKLKKPRIKEIIKRQEIKQSPVDRRMEEEQGNMHVM